MAGVSSLTGSLTTATTLRTSRGQNLPQNDQASPPAAPLARSFDSVDFSPAAIAAADAAREIASGNTKEIRLDKVNKAKAAIARGDFDSDEKLNIVADRLLKALKQLD